MNPRWVNDPRGCIKIYEIPNTPEIVSYGIGGDTAGDGSDYFTAHVINSKTLKQCATLRLQTDSDLYARQMYCLGMYYNQAVIGIENNFDSYPMKELERLGYPYQYVEEKEDTYTHKIVKRYGFRTTSRTRPEIIDYLKQIVRDETECINDEDTLREMLEFIYNDQMRPEAQENSHDDLVMGLAIAYRILSQVREDRTKIVTPHDTFFKKDVGQRRERITVV